MAKAIAFMPQGTTDVVRDASASDFLSGFQIKFGMTFQSYCS
jgi:hypothetical protein